ncbi:hypothetical protein HDU85_004671 [Gaertneriomyces sp. JEL0708]|nr:hypothetical protein HDU85_004671 [Gaertneriomyces sp. JEL0708]
MLCKNFFLASALAVLGVSAQIDTILGPIPATKLGPTIGNLYVPELLVDTGVGRLMVANVGQSGCKRLPAGAIGQESNLPIMVEDVAMKRDKQIAFLSSDPYRVGTDRTGGWMPGMAHLDVEYGSRGNGAIFVYGYGKDAQGTGAAQFMTKLTINPALPSFHPHGMNYVELGNGVLRFFIVNHRAQAPYNENGLYSVVEVLDYDPAVPAELKPVATIENPLIWTPNNVAPVGPTSFYVSNDHKYRSGLLRNLEEYGQLTTSNIVYCDFASSNPCKVVADDLRGSNGMATDGNLIYVSQAMGGELLAFARNADQTLKLSKRYNLDYLPDNVNYEPATKRLTVTGHPKAFAFQDFAAGKASTAPSWADVIQPDGTTKRIFSDTGDLISGSTVMAVDSARDVALIGAVFDPTTGLVRCKVPKGY